MELGLSFLLFFIFSGSCLFLTSLHFSLQETKENTQRQHAAITWQGSSTSSDTYATCATHPQPSPNEPVHSCSVSKPMVPRQQSDGGLIGSNTADRANLPMPHRSLSAHAMQPLANHQQHHHQPHQQTKFVTKHQDCGTPNCSLSRVSSMTSTRRRARFDGEDRVRLFSSSSSSSGESLTVVCEDRKETSNAAASSPLSYSVASKTFHHVGSSGELPMQ